MFFYNEDDFCKVKKNLTKLILGLILCFCPYLVAIAQPQPQAETSVKQKGIFSKYFKKAKIWEESYKTRLEIKYFEDRLKKTPDDVELLKTYATYLKEHNYYNEAIVIYKRLFGLTKNDIYKKNIDEIKSIRKSQGVEKLFLDYVNQAKKYESQGNIVKANEYYLKAKKIFPERFEAKFGLSKTYCWLNQPKLAIKTYQELIKQSPDNIDLLEAYAKCLKDNKDYAHAIKLYKKLLTLTKDEKYNKNLQEIISLKKGGTPKLTGSELAKNTEQDKVFFDYIKKAQKYESQGKIQKANEYYLKAEKIFPKKYEAKFGLAKTYGWLGKKKLALFYYQQLLKEAPNNPDLISAYNKFSKENIAYKGPQAKTKQNLLAEKVKAEKINSEKEKLFSDFIKQAKTYEDEGKAAEANEYYLKAGKIFPSRYEAKFGLAKTFGWLHKHELALNYYKELLAQSPDNVDLLEAYANYLKDTKNYSEAMEIYNKLLSQSKNEKYKANIAEIYFLQRDYETSLTLYFDIYNKDPTNPEIQKAIALLYFVLGDFKKSIDFYQKYLAQKDDPESILNYAKSLFYSKNIQSAKEILEGYVKAYPDNADGLSTLADIYIAIKELPQAIDLNEKATSIEPENIKFRIQTARIDIALKNYCEAKNLLFKLSKIEPNNTEIIENLGDISFYTGDFTQALRYYQCIPDFKNNNRLNYKIAQATHYGKNYELAKCLYGQLLNDPEYSNKAKIGLAEIQITENKPLKAREILKTVLQNEPENVDARKNMAISYFSTGDNFKSIEILEKLPKDDSDVTYNLAKAYDGIERKDIALELLNDSTQENAKALQKQILMQIKPAFEPIYNLYRMTGNANAGKYQKEGGNGYFYPRPNIRTVGTIITTKYQNVTNIAATRGTLYSVGLEGRPHDHVAFKSAIGVEDFTNNGMIILGNAIVKAYPNDIVSCTSGYIRSLDEIDSYMSAAGVVPTVGPFANQLVGRIIDNKFVVANLAFKLPKKFYSYGGFNIGYKYGSNSPPNLYKEVPVGFGKVIYSAPEKKHINQVLFGYDLYYTAYNQDRSGFGGANLNNTPVGSDGGSPTPSPGNPGVGGYFSPTFFIANKFPMTIKGSFKNTKLKYVVSGFIGVQTIQGSIGLVSGSGTGLRSNAYYGYLVGLRYNENGKYGWGFDYTFNNYMTVAQHLLKVNLLIRF